MPHLRFGGAVNLMSVEQVAVDSVSAVNRSLLVRDLRTRSLVFQSKPYEAHIQFSTYCNMSCVMCWNGHNPETVDMDAGMLDRIATQLTPQLELVIPHDGSEPTARRWDEIVDFARRCGMRLELTTNLQGLSDHRLRAAADVLDSVHLSIDSHDPKILAAIRPGARTRSIFRNLPRVIAAADELGIHALVTAVFMMQNARTLPATVEYLGGIGAREVHIIPLVDTNGESAAMDPQLVLDATELAAIKGEIIAAARQADVLLHWGVGGREQFDGVDADAARDPAEDTWSGAARRAGEFDELLHPGFCRFAHSALRVAVDGSIAPCGYSADGELELGSLATQDFDGIWNGSTAMDLRRAMFTRDLPALCAGCAHAAIPPEQAAIPLLQRLEKQVGASAANAANVAVAGPVHGCRTPTEPTFEIGVSVRSCLDVRLHLALGVEPGTDVDLVAADPAGANASWRLPPGYWEQLEENLGYWWVLSAVRDGRRELLSESARLLIRHQPIDRVTGSSLRYEARRPPPQPEPVTFLQRVAQRARPAAP